LLLDYPDDELCASRNRIGEAIGALPRSLAAADLRDFWTWFATAQPSQLRLDYVKTFDHKRRSALYVTFAPYGDTRRRGAALAELRHQYQAAGYRERDGELPDYLPTVLQFAALAPENAADQVLDAARPGIEMIESSLDAQRSPYAAVIKAVARCLPPPRQTPPADPGVDLVMPVSRSTEPKVEVLV